MPRAVHAFKIYPPEVEGGIPNVIATIVGGVRDGWTHEIVVSRARGWGRSDTVEGVPVERIASAGTLWSLPIAPTYPPSLLARSRRADLVAVHAPFPLADLALATGGRALPPLVVHWHADIVRQRMSRPLYAPLVRRTLKRAARILVTHDNVVASSPALHEFAEKISVVPYGLDPAPWTELRPEDRAAITEIAADPRPLFIGIGRLVGYKGFDVLIEAAQKVDARFVVCGRGPEKATLEREISRLGLGERFRIEENASRERLKRLLHACRALVMPSISIAEAFGLVQVEAMFCGRPVVNTALATAVPEVARHEREGLTVFPRDACGLARALERLIERPHWADALGAAARTRALGEFTAATFSARVSRIYDEVVAQAGER